jgi:transcriptional regulator with XRE-family HTH domain
MSEKFGKVLIELRGKYGLLQKDLANILDVSTSYIGMLEDGTRGNLQSSDTIWKLAQRISDNPKDMDLLLSAANLSLDRTDVQEQYFQQADRVKEVWIFAKRIVDTEPSWLKVVKNNLLRGVNYFYVTSVQSRFSWRIQPFQFHPRIFGGELPINLDFLLVAAFLIRCNLLFQLFFAANSFFDSDTFQNAQLIFRHIQPRPVFWCVDKLDSPKNPPRSVRR